jgi:hypothetical protein
MFAIAFSTPWESGSIVYGGAPRERQERVERMVQLSSPEKFTRDRAPGAAADTRCGCGDAWELQNDPHDRARELAERLPEALAICGPGDGAVSRALTPHVEGAMVEALKKHPELLVKAVGAVGISLALHPFALLGRLVLAVPRIFRRDADDGEVIEKLLLHRATHAVMQHVFVEREEATAAREEGRKIAAMLAYLQQSLRDPKLLERYAGIETIRVEKLTYAIFAGDLAVLIAVIRGKHPERAVARCREELAAIHARHVVALGDFEADAGGAGKFLLPLKK